MNKISYVAGTTPAPEQTEMQAGLSKAETAKTETVKKEETVKTIEQETEQMSSQGDAYISSREQKPSGLYNVSRYKDGKTVIKYDDPRRSQGGQEMQSVTSLEAKRDSIKMKIKTEMDAGKVKELKKKLKEIEQKIKNSN